VGNRVTRWHVELAGLLIGRCPEFSEAAPFFPLLNEGGPSGFGGRVTAIARIEPPLQIGSLLFVVAIEAGKLLLDIRQNRRTHVRRQLRRRQHLIDCPDAKARCLPAERSRNICAVISVRSKPRSPRYGIEHRHRLRLRTGRLAGFIKPCQSSVSIKPPSGPCWIHDQADGYRTMVRRDDIGSVTPRCRHFICSATYVECR
jgi:hypothetical protein